MGFRRAKSTQGNTNCQKNIFEDDQVPGHHPRALSVHVGIYFKVENNSFELTRIFKESFIDQR